MDIKKLVAQLIAARAITKGSKTMVKLGGESVNYTAISDGEKIWYEAKVKIIDYVDKNVYRKTNNTYNLPYGLEPAEGLSARDIADMYKEYLTESHVEYVDSNNKVVEWQEPIQEQGTKIAL